MKNIITPQTISLIDWREFFRFWKIKDDTNAEATKLKNDAINLIQKLQDENFDIGKAKIEFFDVEKKDDDIIVLAKEPVFVRFLRQQTKKKDGEAYLCLSDFIESGQKIGVFAITAGAEFEKKSREFAQNDDLYSSLLYTSVSQRLVEAFSVFYHKEYCGEKNSIRAAVGYPSLPDMRVMAKIDEILELNSVGITLRENYMMSPLSSVAGFYLIHPKAKYFAVGKIGKDQIFDYAKRGGESVSDVEKWLKI